MFAIEVESIKSMEEFLLNVVFAGEKLDVVNENTVELAVSVFELINSLRAKGSNKFVAKSFGGKIANFGGRVGAKNFVANSLH